MHTIRAFARTKGRWQRGAGVLLRGALVVALAVPAWIIGPPREAAAIEWTDFDEAVEADQVSGISPFFSWGTNGGSPGWHATEDLTGASWDKDWIQSGSWFFLEPAQYLMQTRVKGPGYLYYYWRIDGHDSAGGGLADLSSDIGKDTCTVHMDTYETTLAGIEGHTEWERVRIEVPAGTHTIYWKYNRRIADASDGAIRKRVAWLDDFVYYPIETVSLAEALDTSLPGRGSQSSAWFGQKTHSRDGVDAAASGLVTDGQSSWLELFTDGPGKLEFDWAVNSQAGDYVRLFVDDREVARRDGIGDWEEMTLSLEGEGEHRVRWLYEKDLYGSEGLDQAFVDDVRFMPSLSTALDSEEVEWRTSGVSDWYGQTEDSADGVDAARSGRMIDSGSGQASLLEVDVDGPGYASFDWRVSSEDGSDWGRFYIDDVELRAITGETSWESVVETLTPGPHTLKWEYWKDHSFSVGDDCLYVDDFWAPSLPDAVDNRKDRFVNTGSTDWVWMGEIEDNAYDDDIAVPALADQWASMAATVQAPAAVSFRNLSRGGDISWGVNGSLTNPGASAGDLVTFMVPGWSESSVGWNGRSTAGGYAAVDEIRTHSFEEITGDDHIREMLISPNLRAWGLGANPGLDELAEVDGWIQSPVVASGDIDFGWRTPAGSQRWTTWVRGPATVDFDWRRDLSGGQGVFLVDGLENARLETAVASESVSVELEGGLHQLEWLCTGSEADYLGDWHPPDAQIAMTRLQVRSLAVALDTTRLVRRDPLDPVWEWEQDSQAHGGALARSAPIGDRGRTSFSLPVSGPATLGFRWRVSSEPRFDELSVSMDGTTLEAISGDQPWKEKTLRVPPGDHVVEWAYQKDNDEVRGSDAGFVDRIEVTSEPAVGVDISGEHDPTTGWYSEEPAVTLTAAGADGFIYWIDEDPGETSVYEYSAADYLALASTGDVLGNPGTFTVGAGSHEVFYCAYKDVGDAFRVYGVGSTALDVDTDAPSTAITWSSHSVAATVTAVPYGGAWSGGSTVNIVSQVSDASDNLVGARVIWERTTGQGAAQVTAPVFSESIEAGAQSLLSPTLSSGTGYSVRIVADDIAGNSSEAERGFFWIDVDAPENPAILNAEAGRPGALPAYVRPGASLNFISADEHSGVSGMSYLIDSQPFSIPDTLADDTGAAVVPPGASGVVYVHARAVDHVGNWSATTHQMFLVDGEAPSGDAYLTDHILMPDQDVTSDPYTIGSTVELISDVADDVGVASMRVRTGGVTGPWQSFAETTTVELDPLDSSPEVAVDYADSAGNVFTATTEIRRDDTPPVIESLVVDGDAPIASSRSTTLSVVASDAVWMSVWQGAPGGDAPVVYAPQSAFAISPMTPDGEVTIGATVYDAAGNSAAGSDTIALDTGVPSTPVIVSATHPDESSWYADGSPELTWSSADSASGIVGYSHAFDRSAVTIPDDSLEGTGTTLSTGPLADGEYYLHVKALDGAGHWSDVAHRRVRVDAGAPVGSMEILPSVAEIATHTVDVVSDVDFAGSVTRSMRMSLNGGATWSSWDAYESSLTVALAAGDGARTIDVEYRDDQGLVLALSDSVVVDTAAPVGSISIDLGATYAVSRDVTLTIDAGDAVAMRVFGDVADTGWIVPASQLVATLEGVEGERQVRLELRDALGNTSAAYSDTIVFDETPPVVALSIGGANPSAARDVSLAVDAGDAVEMQISEDADFSAASWVAAASSADITFSTGEGSRTLYLRARDAAGNVSDVVSDTVVIDTLAPGAPSVTSATHPDQAAWYPSGLVDVSFPAIDEGSGVAGYSYLLDASALAVPDAVTDAAASALNGVAVAEGATYLHVRAIDAAGNVGPSSHFKIQVDATPPSGPFALDSGAACTTTATVDADSSGIGDVGSGVTHMRFNLGGGWMAWEPFSAHKQLALAGGDGTVFVQAEYHDAAGNVHAVFDTIVLDTSPPVGAMSLDDDATYAYSSVMRIDSAVSDATLMRWDYGEGFSAWEPYAAHKTVAVAVPEGVVTVDVEYRDAAGNTLLCTDDIVLDMSPPTDPALSSTSHAEDSASAANVIEMQATGATDAASGVYGYSVSFTRDATATPDETVDVLLPTTSFSSEPLDDGVWYANLRTRDSAGFWTSTVHSGPFLIDTQAPTVTHDAQAVYDDPARITLVASGEGSALAIEYSSDGDATQTVMAEQAVVEVDSAGPHTITFRAVDAAGNASEWQTCAFRIASDVVRVDGRDRYQTAIEIARQGFDPGADKSWPDVSHVVLASGEDRSAADPLAASGLVWAYDAPLMLASARGASPQLVEALAEIARANGTLTVHVVGGPAAVPESLLAATESAVEAESDCEVTIDRILSTGDRYDMAVAIARRMREVADADPEKEMPDVALIANGAEPRAFYDALAFSPITARTGAPLLLTGATAVPAETAGAIDELGLTRVIVGGGSASVSEAVRLRLDAERWSGRTRYSTAAAIAENAVAEGWLDTRVAGIAAKLPDALGGGSMLGSRGGTLLLTDQAYLPPDTLGWFEAHDETLEECYVFGGTASVRPSAVEELSQALR